MRRIVPHADTTVCSRYVFAFATGHVGTHSFDSAASYQSGGAPLSSVAFSFEKGGLTPSEYANLTVASESAHAREQYLPLLMATGGPWSRNITTCVDLSNPVQYFIEGLLHVLRPVASIALVRIRRPVMEVARSYASTSTDTKLTPGFWTPSPEANPARVQLPLPRPAWKALVPFQQALWVADEAEARWQRLEGRLRAEAAAGEPAVALHSVWWSKEEPNSMGVALREVASLLRLQVAPAVHDAGSHFQGKTPSRGMSNETRALEACLFHMYHRLMTTCSAPYYARSFGQRELPTKPAACRIPATEGCDAAVNAAAALAPATNPWRAINEHVEHKRERIAEQTWHQIIGGLSVPVVAFSLYGCARALKHRKYEKVSRDET